MSTGRKENSFPSFMQKMWLLSFLDDSPYRTQGPRTDTIEGYRNRLLSSGNLLLFLLYRLDWTLFMEVA